MKPTLEFEKTDRRLERQLEELKKHSKLQGVDLEHEVAAMERKIERLAGRSMKT